MCQRPLKKVPTTHLLLSVRSVKKIYSSLDSILSALIIVTMATKELSQTQHLGNIQDLI